MINEKAKEIMQLLKKAYCNTHTDAQLKKNREVIDAYDSAIKALEQESVLDKIRAEIKEELRFCPLTEGLERALEIIDKYKAEKE